MSATGRGAVRLADDAYFTPDQLARDLVDLLGEAPLGAARVLEPHGGGGAFVRALAARGARVEACEVNPDLHPGLRQSGAAHVHRGDFLDLDEGSFDWVIGNPPYQNAEAHVRKALGVSRNVVFLLRLAFLESRERFALWREFPLHRVWALSARPAFGGFSSTETDKAAYAWFWWKVPAEGDARVSVAGFAAPKRKPYTRVVPLRRWQMLPRDVALLLGPLGIVPGQHVGVLDGELDPLWSGAAALGAVPYPTEPGKLPFRWDLVVGAPALDRVEDIVPTVTSTLRATGALRLLLPLHALESRRRLPFWQGWPPDTVEVLSRRPRLADGSTGAHAMAWFVWGAAPSDDGATRLVVAPPPPRARGS